MASKKGEKKPLWTKEELRKEEVRGIFAIGVIAALISPKIVGFSITVFGVNVFDVLMFQVILWIGYLLLMCVGLSDDIGESLFEEGRLRDAFCQITISCRVWAKIFFVMGILLFLLTALVTVSAMAATFR